MLIGLLYCHQVFSFRLNLPRALGQVERMRTFNGLRHWCHCDIWWNTGANKSRSDSLSSTAIKILRLCTHFICYENSFKTSTHTMGRSMSPHRRECQPSRGRQHKILPIWENFWAVFHVGYFDALLGYENYRTQKLESLSLTKQKVSGCVRRTSFFSLLSSSSALWNFIVLLLTLYSVFWDTLTIACLQITSKYRNGLTEDLLKDMKHKTNIPCRKMLDTCSKHGA